MSSHPGWWGVWGGDGGGAGEEVRVLFLCFFQDYSF